MWYMGGKFRQSKAIVQCLKPYFNENTVYVEPFCGGMWSACRVIDELHPKSVILNDINKPLMLLWDRCIKEGCNFLPTNDEEIEHNYPIYKAKQDDNDPLTAWYGAALSFGGKWFGGVVHGRKNDGTTYVRGTSIKCMNKKLTRCVWQTLNLTSEVMIVSIFPMVLWFIVTHLTQDELRRITLMCGITMPFGSGFVNFRSVVQCLRPVSIVPQILKRYMSGVIQ